MATDKQVTQVSDCCPNEACPVLGKLQKEPENPNISKYGKTKAGRQRYRCSTFGKTFTKTKGTTFYRKRADGDEILEIVALIAEGSRMSSLLRLKEYKEDNIVAWLREAAEHVEAIEERLM